MLVAYIGPVNTMLLNAREVGRAVMCSFDLAFNQTKTYMSLRLVPIIDILYQLQVCRIPLMGGLLHLVQRGGDWAGPQPAHAGPSLRYQM